MWRAWGGCEGWVDYLASFHLSAMPGSVLLVLPRRGNGINPSFLDLTLSSKTCQFSGETVSA